MPTVYDLLTSNFQELLTKLFYQIINECSVKKNDIYSMVTFQNVCLHSRYPLSGSLIKLLCSSN